ncbi:FAS1-like dehydratase domain-containing protein [Cryptosporangium aurantiacum]|uniref:3-methylfumaryl-CoA hydratase n=1 Tax=Cryptosporangium aurantiacum TaxID=134849 RepID=A0A1M7PKR0_9ACTN|nr:MaoC family dehydratase N-terminal domain-containing protein [Cryptosporangium aurantiacum]SHN17766.1 3-methylfumaryl-CoA hydratase [Cryptosporangium aurantiacum]
MSSDAQAAPEAFRVAAEEWRPGPVETTDTVTALPASTFAALLDEPSPVTAAGDPLPPLWHWFLFPSVYPQSALGADGHPADAAFTPPLPERRRMFGGGRLSVTAPLRCGETVTRRSSLASVRTREGGSGWLLLVTVRHEFAVADDVRLVEEQDLVYRRPEDVVNPAVPPQPGGAVPAAPWQFTLTPDPVLLFRFSALTSNAHRIHYDRPYATGVEGHAGLVVHGPLLALLLLEPPRRFAPDRAVETFRWRARRPLFETDLVEVRGEPENDRAVLRAGAGRAPDAVTGEVTYR